MSHPLLTCTVLFNYLGVTAIANKSLRWTGVTKRKQKKLTPSVLDSKMATHVNSSSLDLLSFKKCKTLIYMS